MRGGGFIKKETSRSSRVMDFSADRRFAADNGIISARDFAGHVIKDLILFAKAERTR